MDDLDYIEFDHALNSGDVDYLENLGESLGQETLRPYIGGTMSKTCRNCGRSGLYWFKDKFGKWKLEDSHGIPHFCGDDQSI